MLKHEAVTQSEVPAAETQSRMQMLNTELSLSSEVQMLKQRGDRHNAETRTVSSQGRHSQECNSRG
jgi:hypothetical protein